MSPHSAEQTPAQPSANRHAESMVAKMVGPLIVWDENDTECLYGHIPFTTPWMEINRCTSSFVDDVYLLTLKPEGMDAIPIHCSCSGMERKEKPSHSPFIPTII